MHPTEAEALHRCNLMRKGSSLYQAGKLLGASSMKKKSISNSGSNLYRDIDDVTPDDEGGQRIHTHHKHKSLKKQLETAERRVRDLKPLKDDKQSKHSKKRMQRGKKLQDAKKNVKRLKEKQSYRDHKRGRNND
jgi:hypothetical protein